MKKFWIALFATLSLAGPTDTLAEAKSMSVDELKALYAGKTWFWADGQAFFAPNGKFYAHSGKGSSVSYVEGGWGAYKGGKICFSGIWRSASGSGFNSSCFFHQRDGKTISQRNPVTDWYVFRHAKPKKGEEFSKLVKGDWATSQVRKAKRELPKT